MNRRLIIDGYSLLHHDPELVPLLAGDLLLARQRLVRKLEEVVDSLAGSTVVVFDGRRAGNDAAISSPTLEVRFSPAHQTADTVIERLVVSDPRPEEILVVTSDRGEGQTVAAAGAQVMSCAQFLDWRRQQRERLVRPPRRSKATGPTLGDFFPGRPEPSG